MTRQRLALLVLASSVGWRKRWQVRQWVLVHLALGRPVALNLTIDHGVLTMTNTDHGLVAGCSFIGATTAMHVEAPSGLRLAQ